MVLRSNSKSLSRAFVISTEWSSIADNWCRMIPQRADILPRSVAVSEGTPLGKGILLPLDQTVSRIIPFPFGGALK